MSITIPVTSNNGERPLKLSYNVLISSYLSLLENSYAVTKIHNLGNTVKNISLHKTNNH